MAFVIVIIIIVIVFGQLWSDHRGANPSPLEVDIDDGGVATIK
jgi:hypothetical protein